MSALPALPIGAVLAELGAALAGAGAAVLEAPPGAGKSTIVPLALLEAGWLGGQRIVMLEPRRLAARAIATRMAQLLGEPVGRRVGYRMRLESRVSAETRILVVTEGILTRLLQDDPALEGTALVIFDEFHERHLAADLGLALCLDARRELRPDLRLLVMSATLDGAALAALLGGAPRIVAEGRLYPVDVRHARRAPEHLAREEAEGDCLVFLPGAGEIRRLERALESGLPAGTRVLPLFGELAPEAQARALEPGPGRKVVLATSIAETSLTIEGVRIVVDAGLARRPRFDPASGMSRLETGPVSRAAAEQRRGRAGRLAPGVCYRVYTEALERQLPEATAAEILDSDLAPLALDLACWGTPAARLGWLDPPPAAHLAQAGTLLSALGALDAGGGATPLGRRMAALGVHPRLARMLLGAAGEARPVAAGLAALLSDRDPVRARPGERDADLAKRLVLLDGGAVAGLEGERAALERARRQRGQFERALTAARPPPGVPAVDAADPGVLLALAYPDRIGRRRGESGRYLLANGRGAAFAGPEALSRSEFIVAATLDGAEREARIQLAAALGRDALLGQLGPVLEDVDRIEWDRREAAVVARRERRLGALVVEELPLRAPEPAALAAAMLEGVRELGLAALPWDRAAESLRERVRFLRAESPAAAAEWPDLSDAALAASLEEWLLPYLPGITRRDHLARLELAPILAARLDRAHQGALERLAPTHLVVPSGSRIPIDYAGDAPAVAVRLQEMFGLTRTPTVGHGVPLTIRFLSPAGRPVQVTRDLESFWARGYAEVRRELKGRYPKHYWPENPLEAEPTARVRPKR